MAVSLRMAGDGGGRERLRENPNPRKTLWTAKTSYVHGFITRTSAPSTTQLAKYESCDMLPSVDCKLIVKAKVQDLPRPAPRAFIKS